MKYFILILVCMIVWCFIEPFIITVKRIVINDSVLNGKKIIFATDFHYKKHETYRLKRDVELINAQKPDIILLGGDFVNGHAPEQSLDYKTIANEFGKLHAKFGVFAVLGNHDVWHNAKEITNSLTENKITVLRNSSAKADSIYIAGVEDLKLENPDVSKALENTSNPVILLSHTPDIIEDVPQSVNLTLSGHLHGGQINIPFYGAIIAPSKYKTKFAYGLFNENGRKLFVSRGIGTSILPIRFFCPPEIVVIEFVD